MADVVVLATADWDHPLWTNKQHTAVSLAALGHRVLYVESLGLRPPRKGAADLPRILKRLRRVLRLPRRVKDGVWVWSPLVLPGASHPLAQRLNRLLVRRGLDLARRWLGFRSPLLWTYNPLTLEVLSLSSFAGSIYHCVDRIQAQPEMPADRIERAEQRLCQAVNVVFTTAPELQASLASLNPHTHFFGNVADFDHFSRAWSNPGPCPEPLRQLPSPRLLFIGAIDAYKLDLPALTQLAQRRCDWTFVLVGPVGEADPSTDVKALQACPNVHLPGPRPYDELPEWLAHCDVALLPLQRNSYTQNMFPMKFFEYLGAGRPVVATAIPSLQSFAGAAQLVEPSVEAFETAIGQCLKGLGPSLETRLSLAQRHTYVSRSEGMLAVLAQLGLIDPSWSGGSVSRAVRRALKRGDVDAATAWMRDQWQQNGDVSSLHQLLFRRGARPGSASLQVALFEALAEDASLPLPERSYSRIALTYRALKDRRINLLQRCRLELEPLLDRLEQDPGTWVCQRPNRRNRAKLLISTSTALMLVLATQADRRALLQCSQRIGVWFDRLDIQAIEADAAFRMTRNLCRCLLVEAVAQPTQQVRLRLQRLVAFSHEDRFADHPAQEDHRSIVSLALDDLEQASAAGLERLCALISDEPRDLGVTAADLLTLLRDDGHSA